MKNYFWNMLSNIKNGQLAKRGCIFQTRKKNCVPLLRILAKEGFIVGYQVKQNKIKIILKYKNQRPVINSIQTISKPGRRLYYSIKQIWKINSTKYFIIFSTNQGLKSILDCKKLKIGGEPLVIIS